MKSQPPLISARRGTAIARLDRQASCGLARRAS
jgi:hypothetical protein